MGVILDLVDIFRVEDYQRPLGDDLEHIGTLIVQSGQ